MSRINRWQDILHGISVFSVGPQTTIDVNIALLTCRRAFSTAPKATMMAGELNTIIVKCVQFLVK